jgi:hypothetical protein
MRMRWAGHAVRMGEMRSAYKIVVGTSEEKIIWKDAGCEQGSEG